MPVVELSLKRISKLVGKRAKPHQSIAGSLPYLGLDIEGVSGDTVRVEYSPNRPDFSTDFGIAVGVQGILTNRKGILKLDIKKSGNYEIKVDLSLIHI